MYTTDFGKIYSTRPTRHPPENKNFRFHNHCRQDRQDKDATIFEDRVGKVL